MAELAGLELLLFVLEDRIRLMRVIYPQCEVILDSHSIFSGNIFWQ